MNHKCIYFTQQQLLKNDGATDKVLAQKNAINKLGIKTELAYIEHSEAGWQLHVDNRIVAIEKKYKSLYERLYDYIKKEGHTLMYVRYGANAGFDYNRLLKKVTDCGVKIYLEIPTFPYDGELPLKPLKSLVKALIERYCRNKWSGKVYRIVTFSVDEAIYGIPTVRLSNAPARDLPIKKLRPVDDELKMIAVANLAFWHGYDRLIKGIANYYQAVNSQKVSLTIAGRGNEAIFNGLVELTNSLGMNDYVRFVGSKSSVELDPYFEEADLAIGCLACHRKKIKEVKSLKNVEYAMRGIPMIYSEDNTDFDGRPYVLKVPADDSDIDLKTVCSFVNGLSLTPVDIHESVKDFTWENQFSKVFGEYL